MDGSAFARFCETYNMGHRFIFAASCLAVTSAAFGQSVPPASVDAPGLRPITRTESRKILATISVVDTDAESESDCSHLVHAVYEQSGFPYDYASSRELYVGSTSFTRVRSPQAGDLVVWRGHVGIVLDPKEHSFFSFVRSGPDTQFYDSPYWRSRGLARFYRYMTDKPLGPRRTLEASRHTGQQPLPAASRSSENRPPSKLTTSNSATASDLSSSGTVDTYREIILQVAGKSPAPSEVAAAFAEMNRAFGESLRTRSLSSLGKPIPVIFYREVRVSAVQINGKRGTALVSIASLGAPPNTQVGRPPRWEEQTLAFEKTKRGWVMGPVRETAYVSREVALEALSARLAALAQNRDTTPEQEREQKQIIRFLNMLVPDDASAASAESN